MLQNPQNAGIKAEQNGNEQKHLETVIKTVMKNQSKHKLGGNQSKPYDALFKDINVVLSEFDTTIQDCKKYNQARIHRKYQIRITDLQLEVKMLKEKIRQQQNARSPSKKYIEDLIDQLVVYKSNNQKYLQKIQQLKAQNKILQEKLYNLTHQSGDLITSSHKQKSISGKLSGVRSVATPTSIGYEFNLKGQVVNYLKQQQNIRKITQQAKSKFQQFLKKKIQNITHWSFLEFLTQIDKWHASYFNQNQQKFTHKLRANLLSSLQDSLNEQKLPKIIKPYSVSSSVPYSFDRVNRRKQGYKSNKNYSKLAVTNIYRQKYLLK